MAGFFVQLDEDKVKEYRGAWRYELAGNRYDLHKIRDFVDARILAERGATIYYNQWVITPNVDFFLYQGFNAWQHGYHESPDRQIYRDLVAEGQIYNFVYRQHADPAKVIVRSEEEQWSTWVFAAPEQQIISVRATSEQDARRNATFLCSDAGNLLYRLRGVRTLDHQEILSAQDGRDYLEENKERLVSA